MYALLVGYGFSSCEFSRIRWGIGGWANFALWRGGGCGREDVLNLW